MKQVLLCLLYWSYIQLSASLPIEEKPGFTPWPLEKRAHPALTELQFSGLKGTQIGTSKASHFGIEDPTCRGKMPEDLGKCWSMDAFTVDKMIAARKPAENDCKLPCLFYTAALSGAAERTANPGFYEYLLTGAADDRKYQTIWDLHEPKYYPDEHNLDATPETKCLFLDAEEKDRERGISGCQRRYFMSMSKGMAAECSGEVFLMTMTKLNEKVDVPEDGIWWQVEFPTLIDNDKRADDKKITKITYLQVDFIDAEQLKVKKALPADQKKPPKPTHVGEYWPTGPGKDHLAKSQAPAGKRGDSQPKRSPTTSGNQEDSQQKHSPSTIEFVKRADDSGSEICDDDEECYPYPYKLDAMYEYYKDVGW